MKNILEMKMSGEKN